MAGWGSGQALKHFGRPAGRILEAATDRFQRAQARVLEREGFDEFESMIVRARVPMSIALRLAGRAFFLLYGIPPRRMRRIAPLVIASAIADVYEIKRIKEHGRVYGWHRAGRDLLETAVYAATSDNYGPVSISAAPLVTEVCFRGGTDGSSLVGAHLAAATIGRRIGRKPLHLDNLYYLAIATVGGLGVRRAEIRRVELHQQRREAELSAVRSQARLGGRRRVATTPLVGGSLSNTAIDAVGNSYPALSGARLEPGSALMQVLENDRATRWHDPAVLLSVFIDQWKFEYSRTIERMADQVWEVAFASQTVANILLTPDQELELRTQLQAAAPRGDLSIDAAEGGRLGGPLTLRINSLEGDETIHLTGEPEPALTLADPSAAAPLLGVLWALGQATRASDRIRLTPAVPGMLAFAGASVYADRQIRTRGAGAHHRVVLASLAAGAVQLLGVRAEVNQSPERPDGTPRMPLPNALLAPSVLAGFTWQSFGKQQRATVVGEFAAAAALGWLTIKRPRPLYVLLFNLAASPGAGMLAASRYREYAEQDVLREQAALRARVDDAVAVELARGELEEWHLVDRAAHEAINALRTDLDDDYVKRVELGLLQVADLARTRMDDLAWDAKRPRPEPGP